MNVDVHKFYGNNRWSKGIYNRQIIEGLILHTFRYSKHIIWSQMNNSDLSKSIYRSLTDSNPEYFDPIDLERWVQVFIDLHSNLPQQLPEYNDEERDEGEEDEEEDKQEDKQEEENEEEDDQEEEYQEEEYQEEEYQEEDKEEEEEGDKGENYVLTKEYSICGIKITLKNKFDYKNSWFKPTFVQEFIWAWFDNKINLLATDSNRRFVLGDMFVDAAMCYSQEQDILEKIQHKYSIDTLIKALSFNKDWFHFREGVTCLLRSCYFNKFTQFWIYSQDKTDKIINGIIDNLKAIIDLNDIEQLGFATQAIMLATNLYCRLGEQDKDQLSIIISNLFIKLLEDFQVYAIPNVFDFIKGATFLDQDVIEKNKQLVDNEFNKRNVVLETHQKQLVFAILNLIKKSDLNQLPFSKVHCNSSFLKSLNLESHMIEKFIVLFILKYVDIPFDEEFTDELIDILLLLQTGPDTNQTDSEFEWLCKTIQNVIVSIHNCEVKQKIENLDCITDLTDQLKNLRNRYYSSQDKRGTPKDGENFTNQAVDSEIALILLELLYKVRWNSNFEELRHCKDINFMLIKIYKTLGYLMDSSQDVWVKLWHFSQKMFCINWWNQFLNRLHAEFFIRWVSRLNANKTTQFTIDLFSKVWKNIGNVILNEISKDNIDDSLKNLFNLFEEIGEKYEDKVMFNNPKTKSIFNFLASPTIDKEIDLFCNHIMINKSNELGKHKNNKVKVKNESRA